MVADVQSARLEWEDANTRFERALRDPLRAEALEVQLEVVLSELRKRVGATYTLQELGVAYRVAEAWVRDVLAEHAPARDWPLTLSMVEGAAFYAYSRGAVDYDP
ncbi:MAG: hypothetical protein R6W48_00360 [Gaiellaceae bacterium]